MQKYTKIIWHPKNGMKLHSYRGDITFLLYRYTAIQNYSDFGFIVFPVSIMDRLSSQS
jgi:hypothetical protein